MNVWNKCITIMMALFLAGCATPPDDAQPIQPLLPVNVGLERSNKCVAICIGWTAVDSTSPDFAGWDGDCPGCDLDAETVAKWAKQYAFDSITELHNEQATWGKLQDCVLYNVKDLKPNDLVLLSMSGHGTQLKDDDGDEADGMDEAICTWDKIVRDDELLKLLYKFPSGLRVVLISDQCHSKGNFKGLKRAGRFIVRTATFGKYGKVKGKPLVKKITRKDGWTIQLIQFAGCHEDNYSYGDLTGGRWTTALDNTLKSDLTWQQWFEAAAKKMPSEQEPVLVQFGGGTFVNNSVMR